MKKFTFAGDRYESILIEIIFGLVGISIALMFILLLFPHNMIVAVKKPPQYWVIIGDILKIIWIIISFCFWISVIVHGKKIMKTKEYQGALLKNNVVPEKKLTKEEEKKKYGL
jgi:hypothetical protein